jgi:cytochrome c-type biogenesis protein CcmH/NrfG
MSLESTQRFASGESGYVVVIWSSKAWAVRSLAATCILLGGCATPPITADGDRLLQLAAEVDRRGDPSSAVALYERAAVLSNDSPEVMVQLGEARLASGDAAGAARAFRGILTRRPDDPKALLGLGTALLQTGEVSRASDALARAAPLIGTATAYNRLGTAAMLAGRSEDGLAALLRAHGLAPENLDIGTNLALAQALGGRDADALNTIDQVVRSPLARPSHLRQQLLVLTLAGQEQRVATALPDLNAAERMSLIGKARAIKVLQDPADRARALGILARQAR